MHVLSGQEMVHIWEVGLNQHPLDRAITILALAFPDVPQKRLVTLSIGQRDECLFTVRAKTFGSRFASIITCPACQEQLEVALDVADLVAAPNIAPIGHIQAVQQITIAGYELHFRLPDSLDLAAISGYHDTLAARNLLIRRCVSQAYRDGLAVVIEDVPATVIEAVTEQMDKLDPLAVLDIDLDCSLCKQQIHILFDIVSFFWKEIATQAKRLLCEVHLLARAYGWREADILSMSAARRQFYLKMVS
jgi:hypothetical protein